MLTILSHLAPVTLAGQIADGIVLTLGVLVLIAAWIAWGPEFVEEARTWLPRESTPPPPTYVVHLKAFRAAPKRSSAHRATIVDLATRRKGPVN